MLSRYQFKLPQDIKTLTAILLPWVCETAGHRNPSLAAQLVHTLMTREKNRSSFTLVGAAESNFGQDVTIHRAQQFLLGCAGLQ